MKIVHIFWGLGYGGIETMLVNIANAQVLLGEDVHIVIINELYSKELINGFNNKVKVYLLNRKLQSKGLGFAFRMNRVLMKIQPDAIHLHASGLYSFLWRKELRRASLVTLHALPTGSVKRVYSYFPFLHKSGNVGNIDKIPVVVSISKAVKESLSKNYGINSIVVNNGILTHNFIQRDNQTCEKPLRVVQVSRLEHKDKGQDLLIKAAAKLKGAIHVDFIGDGSSREYLEDLTKSLNAENYVSFLGTKPQAYVSQHLCDYDLFVQSSRYEGFGLTVAEAMASRVPVLVSEGQGPAEVTCGIKYGWLFQNGNAEDLAYQIQYIIDHYNEASQKATDAQLYVQSKYDVSVTAKKYINVYKTLLSNT
jgi:glycosyltransferase involved in cell wall biosynthesis